MVQSGGPGESGQLDREHAGQGEATPPMDWWLREADPYRQMPPARRVAEAERMRTDWQEQLQRVAAGRGSGRRHLSAVPTEAFPDSGAGRWSDATLPPTGSAPIDLSTEPTTELSLEAVFEVVETRTVRITRSVARPAW